jgi:hypothetical protein
VIKDESCTTVQIPPILPIEVEELSLPPAELFEPVIVEPFLFALFWEDASIKPSGKLIGIHQHRERWIHIVEKILQKPTLSRVLRTNDKNDLVFLHPVWFEPGNIYQLFLLLLNSGLSRFAF